MIYFFAPLSGFPVARVGVPEHPPGFLSDPPGFLSDMSCAALAVML